MKKHAAKYYLTGGVLLSVLFFVGVSLLPEGISEFSYRSFPQDCIWLSPLNGFTFEQFALTILSILFATPGFILIAIGISKFPSQIPEWSERAVFRVSLTTVCCASLFLLFLIFFHFKGQTIVDDELTYSMQADLLREGRFADPDGIFIPGEEFTIASRVGVTGKYLPGEPFLQIPGSLLGIPAASHFILFVCTCCFVFVSFSRLWSRSVASLGMMLFAISPTMLFTAATGQSQMGGLFSFSLIVLGYAFVKTNETHKGAFILSLGIAIGLWIRPHGTLPVAFAFGLYTLYFLLKNRKYIVILVLFLPSALSGFALLYYNRYITGDPFSLPWNLYFPIERYGFGEYVPGQYYTFLDALRNLVVVISRLNLWWLGWPSSLILLFFWFRWKRPGKGIFVFAAAAGATILFHFFYYSIGISDTGPVYHLELLLPMSLLGALTLNEGLRKYHYFTTVLLVVHLVLGTLWFLSYQTGRTGRLLHAVHGEVDAALADIPPHSVVLYEMRCSEKIKFGWVLSGFPRRCRTESCKTLYYPAPVGNVFQQLISEFPGRSCWYYHINKTSLRPELLRCEDAEMYLKRTLTNEPCLEIPSTAKKLLMTEMYYK